eukprot:TRINITY_DN11307_c0_g1_i4.p1 TRINITY_DN11307_c0_g1~~TRINITY_DN11307_c0_g1_i4.p1  ORF type:complete len:1104 (-),score=408.76 TRINITY_DN11307_c0_g1_i4:203-3514(-)
MRKLAEEHTPSFSPKGRKEAPEWADDKIQETLCGSLWDSVHTANSLEGEVRRLRERLAGVEEEAAAQLARLRASHQEEMANQARAAAAKAAALQSRLSDAQAAAKQAESRAQVAEGKAQAAEAYAAQQERLAKDALAQLQGLKDQLLDAQRQLEEDARQHKKDLDRISDERREEARQHKQELAAQKEAHKLAVAQMKRDLDRMAAEVLQLQSQVQSEQKTSAQLRESLSQKEQQLREKAQALEQEEKRRLRERIEAEKAAAAAEAELKKIRGELAAEQENARRIKKEAEARFAAFMADIDQVTHEKKVVTKAKEVTEITLEDEKIVTQRLQSEMDRLWELVNGLKSQLSAEEALRAEAQAECVQLEAKVEHLDREATAAARRHEAEVVEMQLQIDTLIHDLEGLNELVSRLKAEMESERGAFKSQLLSQQRQWHAERLMLIKEHERVVALLQERIAELETRLKANAQGHSKQVEELHQKIAELQAEIEWLRTGLERKLANMSADARAAALRRMNYLVLAWQGAVFKLVFIDWRTITQKALKADKEVQKKGEYALRTKMSRVKAWWFNEWARGSYEQAKRSWAVQQKSLNRSLSDAQSGCEHLQRAVAQQNLDHVRVVQGLQAEIARVRGCSDLCRVLCCPCAPVLTPTMQCCHPCFHSPSTCCCLSCSLAGYQAGVIVQQERSARTELASELDATRRLGGDIKARLQSQIQVEQQRTPPRDSELHRLRSQMSSLAEEYTAQANVQQAEMSQVQRSLEQTLEWSDEQKRRLGKKTEECDVMTRKLKAANDAYLNLSSLNADVDMQLSQALSEIGPLKEALAASQALLVSTIGERDDTLSVSSHLRMTVGSLEHNLAYELQRVKQMHRQVETLSAEADDWQSRASLLKSERDRANQKILLMKDQVDSAIHESDSAQGKLLQALREISLLRKDRDLGEEQLEDLMADRADVERTLYRALHLFEDANMQLFSKDAELGEAREQLELSASRLEQERIDHEDDVGTLYQQLTSSQADAKLENIAHGQACEELHSVTEEFLNSQKQQYLVVHELDAAHMKRVECEAMVDAMQEGTSKLNADQRSLTSDIEHLYNLGSSVNYLSSKSRQAL